MRSIIICSVLALLCSMSLAQDEMASFELDGVDLSAAVEKIGKAFDVEVLCDPVKQKLTAGLSDVTLKEALDAVSASTSCEWRVLRFREIYGKKLTADKARALVSAMEAVQWVPCAIENPGKETVLSLASVPETEAQVPEDMKTLYYVYDPKRALPSEPAPLPPTPGDQPPPFTGSGPRQMEAFRGWLDGMDDTTKAAVFTDMLRATFMKAQSPQQLQSFSESVGSNMSEPEARFMIEYMRTMVRRFDEMQGPGGP